MLPMTLTLLLLGISVESLQFLSTRLSHNEWSSRCHRCCKHGLPSPPWPGFPVSMVAMKGRASKLWWLLVDVKNDDASGGMGSAITSRNCDNRCRWRLTTIIGISVGPGHPTNLIQSYPGLRFSCLSKPEHFIKTRWRSSTGLSYLHSVKLACEILQKKLWVYVTRRRNQWISGWKLRWNKLIMWKVEVWPTEYLLLKVHPEQPSEAVGTPQVTHDISFYYFGTYVLLLRDKILSRLRVYMFLSNMYFSVIQFSEPREGLAIWHYVTTTAVENTSLPIGEVWATPTISRFRSITLLHGSLPGTPSTPHDPLFIPNFAHKKSRITFKLKGVRRWACFGNVIKCCSSFSLQ